jgi:GT2 family glycosyltransferase
MKLSIIIVNYRGWKRLRPCLESLQRLTELSYRWEVIIIDNHSSDNQLGVFIDDFPEFYFVENVGNFGFSNGCNLGASKATGEYLLFLNPDTMVTGEALHDLLIEAEKHPEFTILSCSQVNSNGKDTRPYGLFLTPFTLTSFLRSLYLLTHKKPIPTPLRSGALAMFPEWVSGSVMLISRKNFDRLGGWSEDFWMYYEDADLCKRVETSGGKVVLIKSIRIIHNHGGASRINLDVKALTKSEVIISRHVYIHKHSRGISRFLMQSYLVINNLFLGQLLIALLGLVFFFNPSLRVYPRLYVNILKYYGNAISTKTWMSPRAVNYQKTTANKFENAKAEAA